MHRTTGTHVAGTVAAVNNNGTGVAGIAGGSGKNDGVKIMSCQIFHDKDGGDVAMAGPRPSNTPPTTAARSSSAATATLPAR